MMEDNTKQKKTRFWMLPVELAMAMGRHWRWTLLLLVIAGLVCIAAIMILNHGSGAAEGIYIANGGQTCVQIERGPLGGLHIVEGFPFLMPWGPSDKKLDARFRFGKLQLRQNENPRMSEVWDSERDDIRLHYRAELRPSATTPGDWDLVYAHHEARRDLRLIEFIMDEFEFSGDFFETCAQILFDDSLSSLRNQEYQRSQPALPSFLHRIDNPRLPLYFDVLRAGNDWGKALRHLKAVMEEHPDDPYLMIHRVDLEARAGSLETAQKTWEAWKKKHGRHPDPLLQMMAARAWKNMRHYVWAEDDDLEHFREAFPDGMVDPKDHWTWQEFEVWLAARADYPAQQFRDLPIVMTDELHDTRVSQSIPNFLVVQTIGKASLIHSYFALLEGRFEHARHLVTGTYLLGLDLESHSNFLITRLIGIALRSIACDGFERILVEGCRTESDIDTLCKLFDQLQTLPGQIAPGQLTHGEQTALQTVMGTDTGSYGFGHGNMIELTNRFLASNAKLAILRQGAWARLYLFRRGEWPADIAAMHSEIGAPEVTDPFDTSSTLKMTMDGKRLVVYSVGPDGKDEGGMTPYEPSNGTTSPGDIFFSMPPDRISPLPEGGVRADSAEELLDAVPGGLRIDIFHSRPYKVRLSVIDATTTRPITVFSIGPDAKVEDANIFSTPPAFWKRPGNAIQPVFVHKDQLSNDDASTTSGPLGVTLNVPWDPTNGTLSNGNIFLEIPGRTE